MWHWNYIDTCTKKILNPLYELNSLKIKSTGLKTPKVIARSSCIHKHNMNACEYCKYPSLKKNLFLEKSTKVTKRTLIMRCKKGETWWPLVMRCMEVPLWWFWRWARTAVSTDSCWIRYTPITNVITRL